MYRIEANRIRSLFSGELCAPQRVGKGTRVHSAERSVEEACTLEEERPPLRIVEGELRVDVELRYIRFHI